MTHKVNDFDSSNRTSFQCTLYRKTKPRKKEPSIFFFVVSYVNISAYMFICGKTKKTPTVLLLLVCLRIGDSSSLASSTLISISSTSDCSSASSTFLDFFECYDFFLLCSLFINKTQINTVNEHFFQNKTKKILKTF